MVFRNYACVKQLNQEGRRFMKAIKLLVIMVTCLATSQLSAAEGESPLFDLDHFLTEKKALIEETLPLTEQEKQDF
jgi:hypothetical protein